MLLPGAAGTARRPAGMLLFPFYKALFALAGSGGAEVDEVAAVRGVVPDAGLVLRAVVEDHRARGIPACLEAGPQPVLLGDQDVAQHGAGHLAPALALGREGEPPVLDSHSPAKLLEMACQVRLGPGPLRPVGFGRATRGAGVQERLHTPQ